MGSPAANSSPPNTPDRHTLDPPADETERVRLGGEWLQIRPIRPADAGAHRAFVGRLSPADLRFRFFTAVHELPEEEITRLTAVDHITETAIIAIREASGETVGVVRLACLPGRREGEFAIVVQEDMQRKGLGTLLMHRLIGWARRRGLARMTGEVLAENAGMLKFASHLGFELHREPGAPGVVEARLALNGPAGPGTAG